MSRFQWLVVAVVVVLAAVLGALGAVVLLRDGESGEPDGQPAPTFPPAPELVPEAARNVILVNGDGMGAAQREAARLALAGVDGQLAMDRLPVHGWQTTEPDDPEAVVTDSAAAATAWSTGQRTTNGAISVGPDGEPLTPLGVVAKESGRSTGLVTTSTVTDASPAAFFASVASRGDEDEIARQYVEETRPDVILGGGEDWWYPEGEDGPLPAGQDDDEGSRSGEGNLVELAQGAGYEYITDAAGLERAQGPQLLGLFANGTMFVSASEDEGGEYSPSVPLARMTATALDVLSADEDGFFLLVEEEGIDAAGHRNNADLLLASMAALEDTVDVLLEFAAANPDTLLIITGDHDAGGLSIEDADEESGSGSSEDGPFDVAGSDRQFDLDWTTNDHTGVPTPVTAFGPGSAALAGVYPNTRLHEVMLGALTTAG